MRRIAPLVMALAAAVLAAPGAASAAPTIGPDDLVVVAGPGSSLDPASGAVRVSVQPGGGVWQSATVSNRGRVRFTVEVHGEGDKGDWIRPAFETVLVEPGGSATIDFTVAPPADAAREDATAELVVDVVEAPEVSRTLELVISVLGPAVVEAPATVPAAAESRDEATAPAPKAAVPGGRSTAETLVFLAIFAALGALVAWTVVPPLVRVLRAWRQRTPAPASRPRPEKPPVDDIRTRVDAARAKATARRAPPRAAAFVDPLAASVTDALVTAEPPARKQRVRRTSLDLDALNRALNG